MRIGIDLGGTKIEGLLLTPDGREVERIRISTPQGDYAATLEAVAGLVRQLEALTPEDAPTIGVGIPGAQSRATGLIKNANSTCLIGQPLSHDLAQAIGRDVRLANDANCFAVSEAHDGAAAGAEVAFGVILGTGVGGGIAINTGTASAWAGANAIAGEWGHNPLPWPRDDERPGPACYCGQAGCIETFLSGPGLARDHLAHSGATLDAAEIALRAAANDPTCDATLTRYENRLARALASVINILDPDVVVLGGGLSNIERLYANVPMLWGQWVFSDTVTTKLVRNVHGDSSGVRGAAWLWD